MKILTLVSVILLAGCQTVKEPTPLPRPAPPETVPAARTVAAVAPAVVPVPMTVDPRVKRQAQMIEALINQNEALTAKLAAKKPAEASPPQDSIPVQPVAKAAPPAEVEHTIAPNAEGVIDLVALKPGPEQGETNPFVVRTEPKEGGREITLHVSGIIMGATPCALINERLVQGGEIVESLSVERIESDAVLFRLGEHRLRVPVAEKSVRVRLPL
jgi:hypothetical protein